MGYRFISKSSSTPILIHLVLPNQGHPTEAFNIHLNNYPTTWIQGDATKVPFPNAYLYFYMPLFL
jgi:hypothetical protein